MKKTELKLRNEKILVMRRNLNKRTGKYPTLEEISKAFNLTRERVRQILDEEFGVRGTVNHSIILKKTCKLCPAILIYFKNKMKPPVYCRNCYKTRPLIQGRTKEEKAEYNHKRYLEDKRKGYFKEYYHRPEVVERRRVWQHSERFKAYRREYQKKHGIHRQTTS